MDPTHKVRGPNPSYSLYQREIFRRGSETGNLPTFSTDPDALEKSAREKLGERASNDLNAGAGIGWTDSANRQAFYNWRIVPKMLVDTNVRDLTTTIFGHTIPAPIILAPIAMTKLYSPQGELTPAKVAGELGLPFVMSTAASQPIETVAQANEVGSSHLNESNIVHRYEGPNGGNPRATAPRFFQLYAGHEEDITLNLMERAWFAGFDVLVFTVDSWQVGWRPSEVALANYAPYYGKTGSEVGLSDEIFEKKHGVQQRSNPGTWVDTQVWHGKAHTWEKVRWVNYQWKRITGGRPMAIKGILSAEDAKRAVEMGVDAIWVSNHAGRQVDGAVAALDALPEISKAVGDTTTIIFDSGIRTGSDIVKALALGAHCVSIGRLYVWGMANGGDYGVRHVLKSLLADLDITMTVGGFRSLSQDVRGKADSILRFHPHGRALTNGHTNGNGHAKL